jgi:hypothetical protein
VVVIPSRILCGVDDHSQQQSRDIRHAYNVIELKAKKFVNNVDLVSVDELMLDGESSEGIVMSTFYLAVREFVTTNAVD